MCLFNKRPRISKMALGDRAEGQKLTPHLLLLLNIRVLNSQDCHSVVLIMLHFHKFGDLEIQRSYTIQLAKMYSIPFVCFLCWPPTSGKKLTKRPFDRYGLLVDPLVGRHILLRLGLANKQLNAWRHRDGRPA